MCRSSPRLGLRTADCGEPFLLRFVSFVARTATPGTVAEGIRAEIRRAAPDLPIESMLTMDEAMSASVAQPRFRMWLLVLFAMIAPSFQTFSVQPRAFEAVVRLVPPTETTLGEVDG